MNLGQFAVRIHKIADTVENNADKLVRKVALAVDGAVVIETPVDTGRARSNWIVNLGQAASGTVPAYSPGKEGDTGGPNSRAALDQGKAIIALYKHGQVIHIANNLDYIQRLNDGWSAQAPAGFVQSAVLAGVQQIGGVRITEEGGVK